MKRKRMLWAAASLLGLLVVLFLIANLFVGPGSTATVVEVARSQCVEDGFPAQKMLVSEVSVNNGLFGFGGHATVEFVADGSFGRDGRRRTKPLVLRVDLRRRMNLERWEAIRVWHEP
jgi:hypothetical protein